MPNKCILLLLDGLGDRAFSVLDHQTPLQAAHTPTLDRLAARGANGLYHASRQGEALPSENAHFAIFGYPPEDFPGRGPLEALGAGIDLALEDVAVLAHFATFKNDHGQLLLRDSTPAAEEPVAQRLMEMAADVSYRGIEIGFRRTHRLYGLVVLRGAVSPFFTDTDPLRDQMALIEPVPLAGYETDAATCNSVAALKAYLLKIYRNLKGHPINQARQQQGLETIDGLVTQRAGRLKPVAPFAQHCGLRGLCLASGLVYHGLSRFLSMDCIKVTDTKHPGKDMAQRLEMARNALADYDFIHVHTKVPDEAGHAKDPVAKKAAIEALDAGLAEVVPKLLHDPEVLLVVTADHATPSGGPLIHSGETVPLLFCGSGVRRDSVCQYNEIAAAHGALGPVRGRELMLMILNALDRAKLQGLMDTPVNQPYWPGKYKAFSI
jgi:2,3-bisphosphoglycerate-independent phosphoglycerate mutase